MNAMRCAAVSVVGLLLLSAGACAQGVKGVKRIGVERAPAKAAGAIRRAAYYVEHLFDARAGGYKPGVRKDATPDKPAAHKRGVAETIRAIDADVIALQEVGSLEALLWFRDEYLKDAG